MKQSTELIENLNSIHDLMLKKQYKNARISLAALIFSINSASVETRSVQHNEVKKESCPNCGADKLWLEQMGDHVYCQKCEHEWNWG